MNFKIICLAAALMGATFINAPARAQDVASQAAPSARQLELTRRYIDLMMSDQFDSALTEMISDAIASDGGAQNLPEADRRFLTELTTELTTDMVPRMIEEMTPVYARILTVEELEALVAFYETDIGRSVVAKTTVAMPEANRAAMSVLPQMLEKMAARICQHYGCTAAELEEMKREMRGEVAAAPARK